MTFLWLIFWLISDTPAIQFSPEVSGWAVGLIVCVAIDLMGSKTLL